MTTANTEPLMKSLSELERQDHVLGKLPADFKFPLFNGKQAVLSQRRSGYQNTARAAREIIDNAYEVGAKRVHVIFERPGKKKRPYERANSVRSIAFIDDGPGMRPGMARLALSWGGGTRFEDPEGIGRFGFGLPNSSINQTKRTEVYVKTEDDKAWSRCVLDINELDEYGLVTVPEPEEVALPKFVADYLKKSGMDLTHGTIVVWKSPDRITFRTTQNLRDHLVNDFGVVYRYLLDDFELQVDGQDIEKVDPLFLMPDARLYLPPEEGGAICPFERTIPVKYRHDEATGTHHLHKLETLEEMEAADPAEGWTVSTVCIQIARFPYGFASSRKEDGEDARTRMKIRRERRGISFVRAKREIDTLSNLSKYPGNWPVLQAYALHWGIEIHFSPDLDDVFGVTSDKQGVRPVFEFWEFVTDWQKGKEEEHVGVHLDQLLNAENRWQAKERKHQAAERRVRALEEQSKKDEPSPAERAAAASSKALGSRRKPSKSESEASQKREAERIAERAKETGEAPDQVARAIRDAQRRKEFGIGFFAEKSGPFMQPDIGAGRQKMALINEAHPFFTEFYAPMVELQDGGRSRLAMDLLLLVLADAELRASDEEAPGFVPKAHLRDVRTHEWSRQLGVGLDILSRADRSDDDEPDEQPELADGADS